MAAAGRVVGLVVLAVVVFGAPVARAEVPYPSPTHNGADPYAYEDYAFVDDGDCSTGANPMGPRDLPSNFDCKNDWKFTNYAPRPGDREFDPAVAGNPAEYGGVKGARVNKAWEVTTGRPDTVIAVMDSGIRWEENSQTIAGLRKKFFLNRGELPRPLGTGCATPGFGGYDRNCDGVFNVVDYETADGCATSCVTDVNGSTMIDPEDLILTYSDTIDDDGNGYPDDISGWDFFENDNDPQDDVDYGHGTGESLDSGFEAEVGSNDGMCPNCMLMEMRVGDSFIADVNHWAEAVVYATDNGADVVQEALGTLNNSSFGQAAADYAYENGVVIVASAADESAGHHNYPSNYDHTMIVNSIIKFVEQGGAPLQEPRSYLYFNGCTNFGGHIHVGVPSSSCSSEATGRSAGYAGLVYSAARNAVARGQISNYIQDDGSEADYPLSAEEVMQIFRLGAEDLDFTPGHSTTGWSTILPVASRRFQSVDGWDMFFGYGRTNIDATLRAVGFDSKTAGPAPKNLIPPEADITSPAWFAPVPPVGSLPVGGRVAANRSSNYSYVLEWAPGVQDNPAAPAPWTQAGSGSGPAAFEGTLGTLDMEQVAAAVRSYGPTVFDPVTDPTSPDLPEKDAFRVRVTVTDADGNVGVFQKQLFVARDAASFAGFPRQIGSDGAGSPAFADLDSDGTDELLLSTSDGFVHAFKPDGFELPGWPVHTDPLPLPQTGDNAYTRGDVTLGHPVFGAVLLGSPALADIVPGDGGALEVAVADLEGKLYVWNHDGSRVPGFPVASDPRLSEEPGCEEVGPPVCDDFLPPDQDQRDRWNAVDHGFNHNPVVADLDPGTTGLELLAGAGDDHVYAWHADGTVVEGWPVFLRDPAKVASVHPETHKITYKGDANQALGSKILVPPSVGDVDEDGDLEVAVAVNEGYSEKPNSSGLRDQISPLLAGLADAGNGRVYLLDHRGTLADASPADVPDHPNEQAYLPGWPVPIATIALELLPYVGEGPDGAPVLADVDGDRDLEMGIAMHAGPGYILEHDGSSKYGEGPDGYVTLASSAGEFKGRAKDSPSFVAVGGGAFGELLPGQMTWAAPAAGLLRLLDVVFPAQQLGAEDHLSAWEMETGTYFPGFPAIMNDLQFFNTPTIADVDGDATPEVLEGSSVYDVRAYNALGAPVSGWPKFTGGWTIAAPATGDFDGDKKLDVAVITREGWLFVWKTTGDACQTPQWPKYQHDLTNSGNYQVPAGLPASCGDEPPTPAPREPSRLRLAPNEAKNRLGGRRTYVARVRDERGDPVAGALVDWSERGPGRFLRRDQRTDSDGEAKAAVTSRSPGNQRIAARARACAPDGDCNDSSVQHWGPLKCDIYGTNGDNRLRGTWRGETICAFAGNDVVRARGGRDVVFAGGGADVVRGGRGRDRLYGGKWRDRLYGGRGADFLNGGAHRDLCRGGPGRDRLRRC